MESSLDDVRTGSELPLTEKFRGLAHFFTGEGSGTFFGSIMANSPNELAAEKGT